MTSPARHVTRPATPDPLGALVRARIQEASCWLMGRTDDAAELWFSPRTGHCFAVPASVVTRAAARDVLLQAGLGVEPAP